MARIKCEKYACKYNYCDACMKDGIRVSSGAVCSSYDTKVDGSPIDVEFGMEENFLANHFNKEVLCNCKTCKSFYSGVCDKKRIDINDVDDLAKCISFEKR